MANQYTKRERGDISRNDFLKSVKDFKEEQLNGPQRYLFMRRPFGVDPKKMTHEYFGANGVPYLIPYEVGCMVPLVIYEQAVCAGLAPPQDESDVKFLPVDDPAVRDYIIIGGTTRNAQARGEGMMPSQ